MFRNKTEVKDYLTQEAKVLTPEIVDVLFSASINITTVSVFNLFIVMNWSVIKSIEVVRLVHLTCKSIEYICSIHLFDSY